MKNFLRLFGLVIILLGVARSQDIVPADLLIIANAGGLEPWEEIRSLRLDASGAGSLTRYASRELGAPAIAKENFTLTPSQLAQIWLTVQQNDFFDLAPQYSRAKMLGRTFARLTVRANGKTHEVRAQNIAVASLNNIMQAINDVAPPNADLAYDISEPPVIYFKQMYGNSPEVTARHSKEALLSPATAFAPPIVQANPALPVSTNPIMAHPGTAAICTITLSEATRQGMIALTAKGEHYGDAVSIEFENTATVECDSGTVAMFLEFSGEAAQPAVVQRILQAIRSHWAGFRASNGKFFTLRLDTKIRSGAAGTPGYHQIELVYDDHDQHSYLHEAGVVNSGTTAGRWVVGKNDAVYAHLAGHLMGLPDAYDYYAKQTDGTFARERDGKIFTAAELATLARPQSFTAAGSAASILAQIEDPNYPGGMLPRSGHENDIMAGVSGGEPRQEDRDAITSSPGILMDLRPGYILNPENYLPGPSQINNTQNMVVTHRESIYADPGEKKSLNGIYAACVDVLKLTPNGKKIFDVGPHLQDWSGVEVAPKLLQLVNYLDEHELFFGTDSTLLGQYPVGPYAIWRLTDNIYHGLPELTAFLEQAGIEVGDQMFDFPKMNSMNDDRKTALAIPPELFVSKVSPRSVITRPGETVTVKSSFAVPVGADSFTTKSTWTLETPSGSGTSLATPADSTVVLTPDMRGIYYVHANVEVTSYASSPDTFQAKSHGGVVVATDEWTETFESGSFTAGSFPWRTSGNVPWQITAYEPHSGKFAAASGTLKLSQTSVLEIDVELPQSGRIEFMYRVSGPSSDHLGFYDGGFLKQYWGGETGWQKASISLSKGKHTVKWKYSKSYPYPSGLGYAWIDDVFFPKGTVVTAVESRTENAPLQYGLSQNYPNPFNPVTTIRYEIPLTNHVSLKIYDVLGNEVETLVNENKAAGKHSVSFDGSKLSSGVYLYRLTAGEFTETKRLVLMK